MKKYKVNCWIHVSVPFEIEADNEQEAEDKARILFEDVDLNRCIAGDSGCETEEIK